MNEINGMIVAGCAWIVLGIIAVTIFIRQVRLKLKRSDYSRAGWILVLCEFSLRLMLVLVVTVGMGGVFVFFGIQDIKLAKKLEAILHPERISAR